MTKTVNQQEIYDQYFEMLIDLVQQGYEPLEIASVLVTQGLSLYRTVMEIEDYNSICDYIQLSRDKIKKFETFPNNLH